MNYFTFKNDEINFMSASKTLLVSSTHTLMTSHWNAMTSPQLGIHKPLSQIISEVNNSKFIQEIIVINSQYIFIIGYHSSRTHKIEVSTLWLEIYQKIYRFKEFYLHYNALGVFHSKGRIASYIWLSTFKPLWLHFLAYIWFGYL